MKYEVARVLRDQDGGVMIVEKKDGTHGPSVCVVESEHGTHGAAARAAKRLSVKAGQLSDYHWVIMRGGVHYDDECDAPFSEL